MTELFVGDQVRYIGEVYTSLKGRIGIISGYSRDDTVLYVTFPGDMTYSMMPDVLELHQRLSDPKNEAATPPMFSATDVNAIQYQIKGIRSHLGALEKTLEMLSGQDIAN